MFSALAAPLRQAVRKEIENAWTEKGRIPPSWTNKSRRRQKRQHLPLFPGCSLGAVHTVPVMVIRSCYLTKRRYFAILTTLATVQTAISIFVLETTALHLPYMDIQNHYKNIFFNFFSTSFESYIGSHREICYKRVVAIFWQQMRSSPWVIENPSHMCAFKAINNFP